MTFSLKNVLQHLSYSENILPSSRSVKVRRRTGRSALFETLEPRQLLSNTPPLVSAVNKTEPVGGMTVNFTGADFTAAFTDADGDALQNIKIDSLPAHGTLTFNGDPATPGEPIAIQGVDNALVYTRDAGFTGTDSFLWSASDGTDYSTTSASVNITVPNTPPTVSAVSATGVTGTVLQFSQATFAAGFHDADDGNTLQSIKITSLPKNGTLALSGAAVKVGQEIPVASITDLSFTPKKNFIGIDSFGWNGSDGQAYADSGATVAVNIATAFDVFGNGVPILNQQKTPTTSNFTDLGSMSTTPDASMQPVTRTYTITNSGDSAITLNAAAVTISGANAGDFTVITPNGASTLGTGQSATFVVQFIPSGVGKRSATITVANASDPGNPFVFNVQGTGVQTSTVATTDANAAGVVQVATTKAGSGPGAINGQILGITYTGYLADGTIFDSTALEGGQPLTFRLDNDYANNQPYINRDTTGNFGQDNPLVAGFEYGLQGLKLGEKRVLIINSDAGYGSAGSGASVPPNSTLIFEIQCVGITTKPQLAIASSTNFAISPGQKAVSAEDNTLFTLPTTNSSISQSFHLYTYGLDDANGASVGTWSFRGAGIKISGAGKKDFGLSLNGKDLTVTFHPHKAGTIKATIHILTNDPLHRDYSFNIQGTSSAGIDLISGFKTVKTPTTPITAGSGKNFPVVLLLQNTGNAAVPAKSKTNIQLYAVNISSGAKTLLTTLNNVNVAGLKANGVRSFHFSVKVPAEFATGTYSLLAEVNQSALLTDATGTLPSPIATVTEVSMTNDSASSAQTFIVVQSS